MKSERFLLTILIISAAGVMVYNVAVRFKSLLTELAETIASR